MARDEEDDATIYAVVVNHEEQYSIWPAERESPLGWTATGKTGLKAECLAHIEEVWTDMRPLSLRRQMEEAARNPPPASEPMDEVAEVPLVQRLAQGRHRVIAGVHPEKSVQGLRESLDRGYVHLTFPDTRGGTELGVQLDPAAGDSRPVDFENRTGTVHLEGRLTLDYVKVRCVADIDLSTLEGYGHLEMLQE